MGGASNRGFAAPLPPGSRGGRSRFGVSPLAPRQGRSPDGSPLGGFGTCVPLPATSDPRPKPWSRKWPDPRPKPWFRLTAMDRNPGSAGFAAPGPKPGPARQIRSRSSFLAGGGALTEVPLSAGQVLGPEGPVSRLMVSHVPEGRLETGGRFTKPAAFASAKGQARSFRLAAASSAALAFRFRPPCRPKATGPASAQAVAGKAFPRCREIVSATPGNCHEKSGRKRQNRLWITRITGVKSGRGRRDCVACSRRAARIKGAPIKLP
ncbi:MAG: hypothetical protein QOG13_953 [Sphingomonadales bacterium]|nr:hypothetical protein [Sphingomonadales bacterium]